MRNHIKNLIATLLVVLGVGFVFLCVTCDPVKTAYVFYSVIGVLAISWVLYPIVYK